MSGVYECDDLAIGAPDEDKDTAVVDSGYLYIIDGGSSGLSSTSDQGIDQDVSDVADTAQSSDQLGLRLDTVRLDGDIYDDLWVTVPGDGCLGTGWGRHQFWLNLDCEIHADDVVDGGPGTDVVYSHLTSTQLATAASTWCQSRALCRSAKTTATRNIRAGCRS